MLAKFAFGVLVVIQITPLAIGGVLPMHRAPSQVELAGPSELASLRERFVKTWQSVEKFEAEYEASPADRRSPQVRKVLAVGAPNRLYAMAAHFSSVITWDSDPFAQEFWIKDGRTVHQWRFNRTYQEEVLQPGAVIPGTIWEDVLVSVLPVWPLTSNPMRVNPVSGIPLLLRDVVLATNAKLLHKREVVAGESCYVLVIGATERLWLSERMNGALVRRDWFEAPTGQVFQQVVVEESKEIGPGQWLPVACRSLRTASGTVTSSGPLIENNIKIKNWQVGSVSPEIFDAKHPPGSLKKVKGSKRFTQDVPGGQDLLDKAAAFAAISTALNRSATSARPSTGWWLWLSGGVIVGGVIWVVGYMRFVDRPKRLSL